MKQKLLYHRLRLRACVSLMIIFGCATAQAQEGRPVRTNASGKPPYNIIFVISDQRTYRLFAGADYSLPAIDTIARRGVTFRNHYIASAMCSPSRASFLTGRPPQVHGVFDQMQHPYTPSDRRSHTPVARTLLLPALPYQCSSLIPLIHICVS